MQYLIKDNVLIGSETTQPFGYLIIFESVQPRIFYNLLTRLYKHVVIHVCLSFRARFKGGFHLTAIVLYQNLPPEKR